MKNAAQAIEFYKKAFGAVELMRMPGPGGLIMHAEIKIGNSIVMLNDETPMCQSKSPETLGGVAGSLFLYVEDVDKSFAQATAAGASTVMPLQDMFWGDRFGTVKDPFGHMWSMATHKEDLTPEQIQERMKAQAPA
ncbi:MAG: VOC family protein [Candidatus Eremiobacterota bacterium]